jgi:NADPH2:quinone reductase
MGMMMGKRLHIVGTMLRSRPIEEKIALARDFSERIIPLFESERVRPIVDRVLSFSEIRSAHQLLESDATFGKVVLRWD